MDDESEPYRTPLAAPEVNDPDFREGTHWLHFYLVEVPRTKQPAVVVIFEVVGYHQSEVISFNVPVTAMQSFLAQLSQLPTARVDNEGVSICLDSKGIPPEVETFSHSSIPPSQPPQS